mmetsp:Transcript_97114/g.258054  ORF Transcript_97114/g.258054 Transcript_97114/m.258054 type:complete len:226 (+) Transcript_97114:144-821(+)
MARVAAGGPPRERVCIRTEASPRFDSPLRTRSTSRGALISEAEARADEPVLPSAKEYSRRRNRAASPRDRLLLWLLGEDTYRHTGSLEQSIIVAIFCTLAASLLFTVAHSCLHPGGACAAERSRRLAYEEEAARLQQEIQELRAGASPFPTPVTALPSPPSADVAALGAPMPAAANPAPVAPVSSLAAPSSAASSRTPMRAGAVAEGRVHPVTRLRGSAAAAAAR